MPGGERSRRLDSIEPRKNGKANGGRQDDYGQLPQSSF
jgi:hypothetical protein